ncbi:transglutaminase [Ktedonobacteria bacterium brp13]|nr:transglutaminase [Ktedonobacteria bacterium brp13]
MVLLAIALYCIVYSITVAHWVDDGNALYYGPVLGLLIGFLIAKIPYMPQALLHIVACIVGYLFSVWVTSALAFQIPYDVAFRYLISAFVGDLSSQPLVASQIVFFFYLSFLCFFLGYFGSWLVYRAMLPWLVAFVYSAIMLVDLNYVSVSMSYMDLYVAIMLGALLLLIARVHLTTQIMRWVEDGLYVDHSWLRKITKRCMQVACLIVVLALPLSLLLPALEQPNSGKVFWARLDTTWGSLLAGHLTLNDLRALAMATGGDASTNYFGENLQVSNSVNLPGGDVLSYSSSDDKSHYLESVSYDHFDGHTWTIAAPYAITAYKDNQTLMPEQGVQPSTQSIFTRVTLLSTINGSRDFLFAPATPDQFNLPVNVMYANVGGDKDALSWSTPSALKTNSTYMVVSNLPTADTAALNTAPLPANNEQYWSSDPQARLYDQVDMQTPSDLSPDVSKTLKQWTQGSTSAYEALQRIETHLSDSASFTYSTNNSAIPANVDVVDWLLQTHSGYCTYYATAMVVMARMLHIPTRMMSGFSTGAYDQTKKSWIVQGSDAHSWVQAYFPGHGWINFDPTPGFGDQSTLSTQPASAHTPVPVQPTAAPTRAVAPQKQPTQQATPGSKSTNATHAASLSPALLYWGLGGFFGLALLAGGIALFVNVRRRRRLPDSVSSLYLRIGRLAAWAGLGPRRWQTPYEYSEMLSRQIAHRDPLLWQLTEHFVHDRWGRPDTTMQPGETANVMRGWPLLRFTLIRRIFFSRRVKNLK